MQISKVPNLFNKLPERPKKVSHETGEVFQMILDQKIKELDDERAMAGGSGLPRETRGKV
jgi:hypothetical protein